MKRSVEFSRASQAVAPSEQIASLHRALKGTEDFHLPVVLLRWRFNPSASITSWAMHVRPAAASRPPRDRQSTGFAVSILFPVILLLAYEPKGRILFSLPPS
jgi:hypothetical protein